MAALLGVDVDRTIAATFVIGAALAAVAGMMYLLYYGVVNAADGFVPGVKRSPPRCSAASAPFPAHARRPADRPDREPSGPPIFSADYKDVAASRSSRGR